MDPSGKVVLITGASSGIGEALAEALARAGAKLLLVARREEVLRGIAKRLRAAQAEVEVFPGDVRDARQMGEAVACAVRTWGRLDIVILSAGLGVYQRITEFDPVPAGDLIAVNVNGVINGVGAALPVMLKQKSGMIVGISSLAAHFSTPLSAAYSASKAAVSNFLTGIRMGSQRHGVNVLIVEPGFIRTPMTEGNKRMPFLLEASQAADRIIRAIRSDKRLLRFPLPMAMLVKLITLLPSSLAKKFL